MIEDIAKHLSELPVQKQMLFLMLLAEFNDEVKQFYVLMHAYLGNVEK